MLQVATVKRLGWGAVVALAMAVGPGPAAADVTATFSKHQTGATTTIDHSEWNKLLATYVVVGADGLNRVRYAAFKASGHAALKRYIKKLEASNPGKLDRPEQFAFWANLYNAKTVDVVLDAYPVKSIRQISINGGIFGYLKKSVGAGGPWKAKIMTVAGEKLSLDDIEHNIMRPIFKDPRVHYSVNCASVGCPNLRREAFTGANLEAILNAAAKAYVNSPRGFSVTASGVVASSIYGWFAADFGGDAAGVLRHAAKYAAPDLRQKLEAAGSIADYRYDWSLNDAK